jgi:hypothetical protein
MKQNLSWNFSRVFQQFPVFRGNQAYITVFARARHLALSLIQLNPVRTPIHSNHQIDLYIVLTSTFDTRWEAFGLTEYSEVFSTISHVRMA